MKARRKDEAFDRGLGEIPDRLRELTDRLQPGGNRAWSIERLDEMFRGGSVPDPLPDGFLPGRLVTTSIWRSFDAFVHGLSSLWMPWEGKSMDGESQTGVNRFLRNVRVPMKLLWPTYTPERELDGRLEAFPFRTRVGPGAIDPEIMVFKIDYDFEANPGLIIRRILDEVVQVADGLYLGKVLYRWGSGYRPIGFFSLTA